MPEYAADAYATIAARLREIEAERNTVGTLLSLAEKLESVRGLSDSSQMFQCMREIMRLAMPDHVPADSTAYDLIPAIAEFCGRDTGAVRSEPWAETARHLALAVQAKFATDPADA